MPQDWRREAIPLGEAPPLWRSQAVSVDPVADAAEDAVAAASTERPDGTRKGPGFLGTLNRPDGGVSTELSIGVGLNGEETLIPMLVPTLTQQERQFLLGFDGDTKDIPKSIIDKAVKHARGRIAQGQSPFMEDRAGLFRRAGVRFMTDLASLPIEKLENFRMGLLALTPGELRETPTRRLAEQAFMLRPNRKQVLEQMVSDPRQIRPLESDLVLAARQSESVTQGFREEARRNLGLLTPPEGALEKVAEATGGLGAIVARLALITRAGRFPLSKLPKWLRPAVTFEIESQAGGGEPGHGAFLGLGMGGIGALPVRGGIKVGAQSAFLGSVIAQQGGDEVDILIGLALPPTLAIPHATRAFVTRSVRKAKTIKDLTDALENARKVREEAERKQGIVREPTEAEVREGYLRYDEKLTQVERNQRLTDIVEFRKFIQRGSSPREALALTRVGKKLPQVVGVKPIDISKVRIPTVEAIAAEAPGKELVRRPLVPAEVSRVEPSKPEPRLMSLERFAEGIKSGEFKPLGTAKSLKLEDQFQERVKRGEFVEVSGVPAPVIPERIVVVQQPGAPKIKPEPGQTLLKPIRLTRGTKSKPARQMTRQEHALALEEGRLPIKPDALSESADDQYDYLVENKFIQDPSAPLAKTTRISDINVEEQKSRTGFEAVAPALEEVAGRIAVIDNTNRRIESLNTKLQRLPKLDREILLDVKGLELSPEVVAQRHGKTTAEVLEIEERAELAIRKAMGEEPPDMTLERRRERIDPRGFIYIPIYPGSVAAQTVDASIQVANRAMNFFVRDMNNAVRRHGGQFGRDLADKFDKIATADSGFAGMFQLEQVEAQRTLNRIRDGTNKAGFDLQEPMAPPGQTWAIARIATASRLDNFIRTPAEMRVIQQVRNSNMSTANMLEQLQIPGNESGRFEITVKSGKIPFRGTPEGRTFLSFSTMEMFDIMYLGPSDPMWKVMIRGFHEANAPHEGYENLTYEGVQKIMLGIRDQVTSGDARSGFRHIGPELERFFDHRPTHLLSPITKRWVPITIVQPRKYIDTNYAKTANRSAVTSALGQDGEIIRQQRKLYLDAGGNDRVFDSAIRALSNIPLEAFNRRPGVEPPSPAVMGHALWRGYAALNNLAAQGVLSATAIVQPTELLGIGAIGGYTDLIISMAKVLPFVPGRRAVLDELTENRSRTVDVVDLTLRRDQIASSAVNVMASVLSRVHGNKFSNEFFNEVPAALLTHRRVFRMVERASKGKRVRNRDIDFIRVLGYNLGDATQLASGKGTSKEYNDAMRRGAETMVGTTSTAAQKSPFANSRTGPFLVRFSQFFTNRTRFWDRRHRIWVQDLETEKKNRARFVRSTFQYGKAMVGIQAAGIWAAYMFAYSREGPAGFKRLTQLAKSDLWEFMRMSFEYATAGPIFGAFYHTVLQGSREGEKVEDSVKQLTRVMFPVAQVFDVVNAIKGVGPYRDRSSSERVIKFIRNHLPFLNTVPGGAIMALLGEFTQDPKVTSAMRAYWTWMLDEANESVPSTGGTVGSRTKEFEQYRIHLRRAKEAQMSGEDPMPHIRKAFKADPRNLGASFKAGKLLDRDELNDEKREALEKFMGPEAYDLIKKYDVLLDQLVIKADYFSRVGAERRGIKLERENRKLNILKRINRPQARIAPKPGPSKAKIAPGREPSERLERVAVMHPSAREEFNKALAAAATAPSTSPETDDALAIALAQIPGT